MTDRAAQFFRQTEPQPSGCLLWTGRHDSEGYPIFRYKQDKRRHEFRAHRWALAYYLGRPVKALALHTCDVRSCVARDHLYEGTHDDNMRDVRERDRQPHKIKGNRNEAQLSGRQLEAPARRPGCPLCGCVCGTGGGADPLPLG